MAEDKWDWTIGRVAGVTGSNLRKRIEAIMSNHVVQTLTTQKKLLLAVTGCLAVAVPTAIGLMNSPTARAQSQPSVAKPKFEVASIRSCNGGGGPNERGEGGSFSSGRLTLNCQVVSGLIQAAYVIFANGVDSADPALVDASPIEGGPGWINSERYTINAKAEGNVTEEMMQGPMLQSLLEDRFKLKIRKESKEVPVYALTVAKGGPKLKPFEEGSCLEEVITFPPTPAPAGQRYCERGGRPGGPNRVLVEEGITVDELCKTFLGGPVAGLGRRVIDKTGLSRKFNIHLEFAPSDEALARLRAKGRDNGEPTAPPLPTALEEQLGLKLESARGSGDFYVIDHIERPSEN
jgi:uncharacterized protein (TIGR03435 family)